MDEMSLIVLEGKVESLAEKIHYLRKAIANVLSQEKILILKKKENIIVKWNILNIRKNFRILFL